jgi:hypothetical protein
MDPIDTIVTLLGVPQKHYINPSRRLKDDTVDLQQFPIEFDHLVRCLHLLGDNFYGYRIQDIKYPRLVNAINYCIKGVDDGGAIVNGGVCKAQELADKLGINILVAGPTESQYTYYYGSDPSGNDNGLLYAIVYHSYEDNYYPIISLAKNANYLFYKQNNSILQLLKPPGSP